MLGPGMMSKLIEARHIVVPFSRMSDSTASDGASSRRINVYRAELAVAMAEFIGTFMFLLMAFVGAQVAVDSAPLSAQKTMAADDGAHSPPPELVKLLYISLSFGVALIVNVAIFANISGGMYNPAVTLGLLLFGRVKWQRAIAAVFAQFIAAIASAAVADALLPGPLTIVNGLGPRVSVARALFLEVFLTAQLVLIVIMHPGGSSKPAYVGLTLFIGHISGVFYSGGSLNPARTLGPAVVIGFSGFDWIYFIGPAMGAALAASVATLFRLVQGE